MNIYTNSNSAFPSQVVSDAEKASWDYGSQVAMAIEYEWFKSGRTNGNRYLTPSSVPNIPIKDTDIFIYPIFGDRLDTIANRYYNDSTLWWIIAKANNIGEGKIGLDMEKKLRIPTQIGDIIDLVETNNS